jgi:hypothetical protein
MSSVYRPTKSIEISAICRDRLSKYGIKVRCKGDDKFLFGPGGSFLIVRELGGSIYLENLAHRAPLLVIKAIMTEYDTELYDGGGGRVWSAESGKHTTWSFDREGYEANGPTKLEKLEAMVLVEGPEWCDVGFIVQWLQAAIDADLVMETYIVDRREGCEEGYTLADAYLLEFAAPAARLAGECLMKKGIFAVNLLSSPYSKMFCVMVKLGFFTLTGARYQMTLPKTLEGSLIAEELQRVIQKESVIDPRPEKFVQVQKRKAVTAMRKKLRGIGDVERLERRMALLAKQADLEVVAPQRKRSASSKR